MPCSEITTKKFSVLSKYFSSLSDPRRISKGNYLYPLHELLFLSLSAVLSDAKSWGQVVVFGETKLDWLRSYYPYESGIPSADVLERLFARLDATEFGKCFTEWVKDKTHLGEGCLISFDGKTARGSAMKSKSLKPLHIVSAYASEYRLTIGQVAVNEKSNEITAIPQLLDLLCLEGCIVSSDAMGCQKDIVKKIREKKSDYLLQVKGNQKALLDEIENLFTHTNLHSESTEEDFGHGRIEKRKCEVITNLTHLNEKKHWHDLKSVVKIERTVTHKSTLKETNEVSFFISSCKQGAEYINSKVRSHWAIENNLHWSLDVLFQEDKSLKKKGNSALNFNIISKMALNIIEKEPTPKVSKITKIKKCGYSDDFRDLVLNL